MTPAAVADEHAEELEGLLLGRSAAEPVSDFQVGDEGSCAGKGGTYHAAHDEGCYHAAGTLQTYYRHDEAGKDEGHQRHSAHGVAAHDGNGVRCHGGEEEGNNEDDGKCHAREEEIAAHDVELEEEEGGKERYDESHDDDLHGDVALCAGAFLLALCLVLLAEGGTDEGEAAEDDGAAVPHADDARHGDAADADALGILENLLRRGCGGSNALLHLEFRPDEGNGGHGNPPDEHRTGTHDGGILQTDDVAHTEQGCRSVAREVEFRLHRELLAEGAEC